MVMSESAGSEVVPMEMHVWEEVRAVFRLVFLVRRKGDLIVRR